MNKNLKRGLLGLLALLLALAVGFAVWAGDYYHAEAPALAVLATGDGITQSGDLTILAGDSDTGIVFYPGAKVEAVAYLPLLQKLQQAGYTCVLVKMPLNMAIFAPNAAQQAFDALPEIRHWYIAGHSMGGAMASAYASEHPEQVEGLILMGAYIYGDYPAQNTLTVYGSFNDNLEEKFTYSENIVKIDGGNHAQFGNYGRQKGDPDATITPDQQQNAAVEAIVNFIEKAG